MPTIQKIHKQIHTAFITFALITTFVPSEGFAANGFDVITMQNGDIHNGTAALERFGIETPYGNISVPYLFMQQLTIGTTDGRDSIKTKAGDIFFGRIINTEITTLRQAEPTLPLQVSSIAVIDFSPLQQRGAGDQPPDAIETDNGDRFSGRIIASDYILQGTDSVSMLGRDKIHIIDLDTVDDSNTHRAQITTHDGEAIQGKLLASTIKTKTRYGQTLEIPLTGVSTLAINVKQLAVATDFHFRREIDPANLFQDQMADGTPGPLMAILPGGEFQRGDLQGDGDGDETPPIHIKLKPFAIGLYEITFDEYGLFCADTRHDMPEDEEWGRGRRPVINVSWKDAQAYTQWLSNKTGHNYRLPSDAEWEYATRGNTNTRYWWGQQVGQTHANCEGCGSIWDGEKSSPVGRFSPNGFGLHDTAGNVFEWVADCLHDDFSQDPTDGSPVDRPDCGKRIIRGGAWSFPPKEIRSANRWRDFPTRRSDDTGFRVARDLD
ncbi:MAG: formylglycine-generating enzyme family protein [Gammaproteobacteria bacterium]|nr:formylglycine-generating enzyme family protein [Gammaproteobacteria bacterium]